MSHPTVDLDDLVHQRARLGILAILSRGDRVEFGHLKDALDLSPGNLSRHLTTLVEARLATVEKGYQGRHPRTWVSITKAGRHAYHDEIATLRSLLALQDATHGEEPSAPGRSRPAADEHPSTDCHLNHRHGHLRTVWWPYWSSSSRLCLGPAARVPRAPAVIRSGPNHFRASGRRWTGWIPRDGDDPVAW